jgi:hypothetical protein
MAQPFIWLEGNDMLVSLAGLRSSTMASTAYLNSSTGVRVTLYDGPTTSATAVITNRNLSYVTATNGTYQGVIQSTESTAFRRGDEGLGVFTLNHSGMNGKWYLSFSAQIRRTT